MKKAIRITIRLAKYREALRTKLIEKGCPAQQLDWAVDALFSSTREEVLMEEINALRKEKREAKS